MKFWFTLLSVFGTFFLWQSTLQTLLSKSEIKTCEITEDADGKKNSDCKSKIFVQMVINSATASGEELEFDISKLKNQKGTEISLEEPLKIKVQKSAVEVVYNTLYLQDVNYFPQEQIIDSSYASCSEGLFLGSLNLKQSTCTVKKDSSGKILRDTQGFCCSCPLLSYLTGIRSGSPKRGDCGFMKGQASAHCLYMPNIWFGLYEIPSYSYNFVITVHGKTIQKDGQEKLTDLFLSPARKTVSTGLFTAKLIGDFMPSNPPPLFNNMYLLKPREPVNEVEPTQNWLLVPKHSVTLDGSECNKPGTSYKAFQHQSNRCEQNKGSCTQNQIKHLISADLERKKNNIHPMYMLSRYGSFKTSKGLKDKDSGKLSGFNLNMRLEGDMGTTVLLEVDASDMAYNVNIGKGVISGFVIKDFEGMTTMGSLILEVTSLVSLPSDYQLSINCTEEIKNISSKSFGLEGRQKLNVTFSIFASTELRADHTCDVFLLASNGLQLHNQTIKFKTTETETKKPQLKTNSTDLGYFKEGGPSSSPSLSPCLCGGFNLVCRLYSGCISGRAIFGGGMLVIIFLSIFCCCSCFFAGPKTTCKLFLCIPCLKKLKKCCKRKKKRKTHQDLYQDQPDVNEDNFEEDRSDVKLRG